MGVLTLNFIDVYEQPLSDVVDIHLDNQTRLSEHHKISATKVSGTVNIKGLNQGDDGLYRLEVDPMSYVTESQFIKVPDSGSVSLTLMFPADIRKVTAVNFQPYASFAKEVCDLLDASKTSCEGAPHGCANGETLFSAWSDIQKAGFLNITEKSRHTPLINGKNPINYYLQLRQVLGDRFFVQVDPALIADTSDSAHAGLFFDAGEALHQPPPGFQHAGSYKTQDRYGNLQLTFHRSTTDATVLADVDLDDAAGFEHFFQVARNALTGKPTHPYNIHEILVGSQRILPKYTLSLDASTSLSVKTPAAKKAAAAANG